MFNDNKKGYYGALYSDSQAYLVFVFVVDVLELSQLDYRPCASESSNRYTAIPRCSLEIKPRFPLSEAGESRAQTS